MSPAVACANAAARPACCFMAAGCIVSAARRLGSEALAAAACSHAASPTVPLPLPLAQQRHLPFCQTLASGTLPACTAWHRQQHCHSCKSEYHTLQPHTDIESIGGAKHSARCSCCRLAVGNANAHGLTHLLLPACQQQICRLSCSKLCHFVLRLAPALPPPLLSAVAYAAANSSAQQPPPAQGAPAARPDGRKSNKGEQAVPSHSADSMHMPASQRKSSQVQHQRPSHCGTLTWQRHASMQPSTLSPCKHA